MTTWEYCVSNDVDVGCGGILARYDAACCMYQVYKVPVINTAYNYRPLEKNNRLVSDSKRINKLQRTTKRSSDKRHIRSV